MNTKENTGIALCFEDWYEANKTELSIQFAESGLDRELCFDPEQELMSRYEDYLDDFTYTVEP